MIKVIFKMEKSLSYGAQEFTYADYKGAAVGDIVVVNTRYGYAIAKVVELNVEDSRFNESNLATVEKIIKSKADQDMEIAIVNAKKQLIEKIRREKILNCLNNYDFNEEDKKLIATMNSQELEVLYKEINR